MTASLDAVATCVTACPLFRTGAARATRTAPAQLAGNDGTRSCAQTVSRRSSPCHARSFNATSCMSGAARPSQTVHWPEPNIDTAVGPVSRTPAFHFSAMTSKASSRDTGSNSPFLSSTPLDFRRSGIVRRSAPYMTFEGKCPLTQFRPRLTGASRSPWVATTRPSLTPTPTEHPVQQDRQAALSHRISGVANRAFAVPVASGMPAAVAVAVAAVTLRNLRRDPDKAMYGASGLRQGRFAGRRERFRNVFEIVACEIGGDHHGC